MYDNTLSGKLIDIKNMMEKYELEITYLEGLLTSTSGPADGIIAELAEHRQRLLELQTEFSNTFKHLEQLQENARKMQKS